VLRAKGYSGHARVIPQFGVDPEVFKPAASAAGLTEPYLVGYSGRLVREKGVDLLLEAMARLEGAWKLCIMGDGPERGNLVALAGRLGIADRVTFRGLIAPSQMPEMYPSLHSLVLPSRTMPNWKEQFGRVLIEAMACGVPVVGSDSGEIPHVIGDAGLVFPEGDADALQSTLALLQGDGALRQKLARRGRSRVLERYTQVQVARATHEVYLETINGEH
jgi:glycosyltransferase involved in cell wall biosynthesis